MTGVYILLYRKKVVYVGKTENWPVRLAAHKSLTFTDAKLIECSKSKLDATEKRLIEIFTPKYNFLHTVKRVGPKMTDEWVIENADLIVRSLEQENSYQPIHKKAVKDLGLSPRYSSSDLTGVVIGRYKRLFNVDYDYKARKFQPLKQDSIE